MTATAQRVGMVLALLLGLLVGRASVQAQSLDQRLFYGVHRLEAPAFGTMMRAADATAFPVFIGGIPAAWIGAGLVRNDGDRTDTYELAVSEVSTLVTTYALKVLIHRTRPYRRLDGVVVRGHGPPRWDPWSFPSGHAAVSFALATSYSLSHERWYVVVPAYAWAASVALSRLWRGVHYPSDVLGGALLGTLVAWSVGRLAPHITPEGWEPSEKATMPILGVRVHF